MVKRLLNSDIPSFLLKDRIKRIYEELCLYANEYNEVPINYEGGINNLMWRYAAHTSLILKLCEENVTKKRIVEIGPSGAGRFMLDFLINRNADVVAIDKIGEGYYLNYRGPSKGKYLNCSMEEISKNFPPKSIDIIQMAYMHPAPCGLEIIEQARNRSLMQRYKANKYLKNYDSTLAKNINMVLKSKGYFVVWYTPTGAYNPNPKKFEEIGFNHEFYDLFLKVPGFYLNIYQKKIN